MCDGSSGCECRPRLRPWEGLPQTPFVLSVLCQWGQEPACAGAVCPAEGKQVPGRGRLFPPGLRSVTGASVAAHGEFFFPPRRMHPNLTKGFGMIGPKDFFPLLDFAFMPNNSLPPRYAGTPRYAPLRAACGACSSTVPALAARRSPGAVCPQLAGAAAAALPSPEGAGVRREAGDGAAHLLPLLPLPSYAQLPSRHEKRGEP